MKVGVGKEKQEGSAVSANSVCRMNGIKPPRL
jgi:hypothetical protein